MCLVKVKEETDYDVPYRVSSYRRDYSPPRRRAARISRTVIEERVPAVSYTRSSRLSIPAPAPAPLPIPAPQPVPTFVEPSPPPPPPTAPPSLPHPPSPPQAHYVEVSPRSSRISSEQSASDYVVREREYRRERREYSPVPNERYEPSPKYETFRYINPPEERYVARERSRSRDERSYRGDPRESAERYRSTRITVGQGEGNRRRDYYR
ncbi:hypothetical protein K490DRAFT_62156 [Saccharata proteae CBS 121410]|uniref:Uncharacterized protein n=1 Tax=Saccharata proteae CBS 121410 TaxID=1314787 RepID=A0A9P4I1I5_9PEZI|nr:hypothetical protein K490DRAFT_62156 [Saccharata proteae CBS 121410]